MSDGNGFASLHTKEIRQQVFEQLLAKITNGDWKQGEKLPSENELSKAMGVSRISVREAIQKLVAINVVETFRGKGTFVKSFSSNSYLTSMSPMLYMSKDDIQSVLEYRKIMEVGIIDLLMKNKKPEDINVLKKYLNRMIEFSEKKNLAKYQEYDVRFHLKMYEMTDNPFIIKISNIVKDVLNSAIGVALTENGAKEGIEFHTQIIECIEANDTKMLRKITKELLDSVERSVEYLEN